LVTGASSGIGRAVAVQAAEEGARVALVARSAEKLETIAKELTAKGADAVAFPADLSQEKERQQLVESVVKRFGGLDVLLNNAGIGSWGHFTGSTDAILRQIMEVNFFAPAELIRLAIPHLKQGQQPAILNLSSMCGRKAMPAWSEYSASKHAVVGLTEALRAELSCFQIDVLLVLPGMTRSEWSQNWLRNDGKADIDWSKGMDPADVARQVLASLKKGKSETVIGSDARWMLLVNRFFPRLVDWLIARKIRRLYQ